jgi:16S rRNA (guanine(966)-N(2))-methyltransferase RsmD
VRSRAGKTKPGAPLPQRRHEVRLIGGVWKRTKLPVLDQPGLRPTPDRVRETLFNWLGQDLTGWHCVDVFAGTGALGLEAASRGATKVTLIEHNPVLVAQLQRLQQQLQAHAVHVVPGDGLRLLKQLAAACVDVVFLDPPFDSTLLDALLLAAQRVLKPEGLVYLEAPTLWQPSALHGLGLCLQRHLKAGAVHAHLLARWAPDTPHKDNQVPAASQVVAP